MKRILLRLVTTMLAGTALVAVTPAVAHAAPTVCEPNYQWYTTSTTNTTLVVQQFKVWTAASNAPLNVTDDFSRTVSMSASFTATVGGSLNISVPVRGFNIAAGINSSAEAAMDVSLSQTAKTTLNFTVPAGNRIAQFTGVRRTVATVSMYQCNSTGTSYSTVWRGSLTGPRYVEAGIANCNDVSYC